MHLIYSVHFHRQEILETRIFRRKESEEANSQVFCIFLKTLIQNVS